jgi:2-keto-3-deoxy-L-rhamnonate aldolase RhmA
MANRLKEILERGQPALGTWITLVDPYSVELLADAGFDWLLVDTEHIPIGRETLKMILVSMKGSSSVPVVRLASNSLDHFQTALDLGAQGVVVPMVSSRADAEKAVSHCRYPPLGVRGFAPVRASRYFQNLEEYASQANREISLFVQIETPVAAANIDQILTTEGVDGIFIGPSDLASFMNLATQTGHPDVVQALDRIMAQARAHSVPFGLPTWSPDEFLRYVELGGQLLTLGSDLHYLSSGMRNDLKGVRNLLQQDREMREATR